MIQAVEGAGGIFMLTSTTAHRRAHPSRPPRPSRHFQMEDQAQDIHEASDASGNAMMCITALPPTFSEKNLLAALVKFPGLRAHSAHYRSNDDDEEALVIEGTLQVVQQAIHNPSSLQLSSVGLQNVKICPFVRDDFPIRGDDLSQDQPTPSNPQAAQRGCAKRLPIDPMGLTPLMKSLLAQCADFQLSEPPASASSAASPPAGPSEQKEEGLPLTPSQIANPPARGRGRGAPSPRGGRASYGRGGGRGKVRGAPPLFQNRANQESDVAAIAGAITAIEATITVAGQTRKRAAPSEAADDDDSDEDIMQSEDDDADHSNDSCGTRPAKKAAPTLPTD
jgi:hypothetical protein